VTFGGRASFERARFFSRAEFGGERGAAFGEWAVFAQARFVADAMFGGADFAGRAIFGRARVYGRLTRFDGATFEQARTFGPLRVPGTLVLDRATFLAPVSVEVSADQVSGHRVRFPEGANLRVLHGDIALDEAQFGQPSILAGPPQESQEQLTDGGTTGPTSGARATPRMVSVRQADVGNLVLGDVDLGPCLFAGAHNLDGLRIEGAPTFRWAPAGWRRDGSWFPWRWSPRQTIAEEQMWRASQHKHSEDWDPPERRALQWLNESSSLPDVQQLDAEQIAGIYRALRKGREDSKDAPGAADFYYGEMEMRRKATPRFSMERLVLSLYWLVSGYGLRASRALVALATTIALGAVLLGLFGFDAGKHPDDGTLLFAAETSISLLRAPDTENLTAVGHIVQIVLRLAGPLFFGLALLSLRGRVKR
jgi:hypothetical protein